MQVDSIGDAPIPEVHPNSPDWLWSGGLHTSPSLYTSPSFKGGAHSPLQQAIHTFSSLSSFQGCRKEAKPFFQWSAERGEGHCLLRGALFSRAHSLDTASFARPHPSNPQRSRRLHYTPPRVALHHMMEQQGTTPGAARLGAEVDERL